MFVSITPSFGNVIWDILIFLFIVHGFSISKYFFFKYAYSTEKLCLLISVALQTVEKSVPFCCQIPTIWLYLNELLQHVSFEWPSDKLFLLCTEDGSDAQLSCRWFSKGLLCFRLQVPGKSKSGEDWTASGNGSPL